MIRYIILSREIFRSMAGLEVIHEIMVATHSRLLKKWF